jgi:tripartite-type tricarboxylate transporter receptor subunit TctC
MLPVNTVENQPRRRARHRAGVGERQGGHMRHRLAIAALALAIPAVAAAQTNDQKNAAREYPSRTVRLVVAAAPGGNPDVLGRVLAQKLTESFNKPFVVENVPGAGGIAAAEMVSKLPPDGHVLMLGDSGALAISAALYAKLSYDPLRDFTPITGLAAVPTVLVVHPSLPVKTLAEFISFAKSQPGKLSYGSAGTGSVHHLTMAVFQSRVGLDLVHVPYRGGTALVTAVLSNEVQAGWSGIPNVLEPIRAGTLRVLCISTEKRSPSLPDVPTAEELGVHGFDIATVIGLQAPAGAPPNIVARLQQAAAKALRAPDVVQRMNNLGMVMVENGTADYARFMKADIERYRAAVTAAGVKVD